MFSVYMYILHSVGGTDHFSLSGPIMGVRLGERHCLSLSALYTCISWAL